MLAAAVAARAAVAAAARQRPVSGGGGAFGSEQPQGAFEAGCRLCSIGGGLVLREDEPLWRWWDCRYGSAVPSSPAEQISSSLDGGGNVSIVQ